MRIPRYLQIQKDNGLVHKLWRAHNKSFIMKQDADKELYLNAITKGLEHISVKKEVKIHAYCVMSNHAHELVKYTGRSKILSTFMRIAHSMFGQSYNKSYGRQGPVAYDRPKTPLLQDHDIHQQKVQFYIEANPLRAGMVKNLKLYKYSSFRFYAWGIIDKFTEKLSAPEWYLRLGKTPKERQARYRSLFDKYLEAGNQRDRRFSRLNYIGDETWCAEKEKTLKSFVKCVGPPEQFIHA